jgi:nitroreductase
MQKGNIAAETGRRIRGSPDQLHSWAKIGARLRRCPGEPERPAVVCGRRDPGSQRDERATLAVHHRHQSKSAGQDSGYREAVMATSASADVHSHAGAMLHAEDFHIFYHAPALIVISAPAQGPWSTEDCALAPQNLMLSAWAVGLGSRWIGFAQGWRGTPAGKHAIGLPDTHTPVAPIIIGHPKFIPPAVPRNAPKINCQE